MTENISLLAVVAEDTEIAENVLISPYCVIEKGVTIAETAKLGVGCVIGKGSRIGPGCVLGNHVTIGENAKLEQEVTVGDHTVITAGTEIGRSSFLGSNSTIGRLPKAASTSTVKKHADLSPLQLGADCIIGCSTVIYAGTRLGDGVFVGDRALIRERCDIGCKVVVGSGGVVENDTTIGQYTKIQTGAYITAYMQIAERVFIAPMVTTTNDNYMGRTEKRFQSIKGATIKKGARIGGGAILLPGIEVAEESFIAAGALVTKDTEASKVHIGFPARPIRNVPEDELLD